MDSNHRLDAPNNDSLEDIEQINDRSDISTLYFTAHKEWEGKAIISDDERQAKRAKEQRALVQSIRPWFAVIGVLVPLPVIVFVIASGIAVNVLHKDNLLFVLLPLIITLATWLIGSYLAIRRVYAIFYEHALRATPFVIVHIALIGLSTQASFLLTRPLRTGAFLHDALIVSAGTLAASVVISGLLLLIWTSPRLTGNSKVGAIAIIALAILATIFTSTLL